jgi:hypothetical protein
VTAIAGGRHAARAMDAYLRDLSTLPGRARATKEAEERALTPGE